MGETRKLKNPVGPSRRLIGIYFKPTTRRAKCGWGGGCFGRLARQPVPGKDFLQPQRHTEWSKDRGDLPDRDEGRAGPRQPASGPLFCMTMEKALKRLEGEYPEMKHTEHQDDVYFVVAPDKTKEVLKQISETWEE